jgi:hypothetical protein
MRPQFPAAKRSGLLADYRAWEKSTFGTTAAEDASDANRDKCIVQ